MPDRVRPTQIGHIFAGVTRAGEASRRPLRGEIQMPQSMSTEPSEISDWGNGDGERKFKKRTRECGVGLGTR